MDARVKPAHERPSGSNRPEAAVARRYGGACQYWQDGDSTYGRIAARKLRGLGWSEAVVTVADV